MNVKIYNLQKAYSTVQGLPVAKLKDLQKLCNDNIIPEKYHATITVFLRKQMQTVVSVI